MLVFWGEGGILRDKIYCLMTSSVSLTNKMADVLFDTACSMIKGDARKKYFRDEGFEGVITTSFEVQSLSGISGTEFFAEVESELGKGKVKFLVRKADAEIRNEMAWVPMFLLDDFLAGPGLSSGRQRPVYN